jgi:hypothetical protein
VHPLRDRFENDPKFQVKFNKFFLYFWLLNMPLVTAVFFLLPGVWAAVSIFYLVQLSLWALVATHYGAVSASEASEQADHLEKLNK